MKILKLHDMADIEPSLYHVKMMSSNKVVKELILRIIRRLPICPMKHKLRSDIVYQVKIFGSTGNDLTGDKWYVLECAYDISLKKIEESDFPLFVSLPYLSEEFTAELIKS